MPINYWTPEDDALLKELYMSMIPVEDIAKRLGRSEWSIKKRVSIIGVNRYNTFHGCDEDCFNCPYPDCMKQTGFYESY